MTTWHEERLLIDGELVPAAGGRDVRDDLARRPRRCSASPPTRPSPTPSARDRRGAARVRHHRVVARPRRSGVRCLRQLAPGAAATTSSALREILVHEVGAPVVEHERPAARRARSTSSAGTPTSLEGYEFVEDLGERDTFAGRHHRWIEKEAAGVVGAIAAYNYPIQLALGEARARARGRLHRRAQGRARHAVGDARARQAHRRGDRHPARRRERAHVVRQRGRRRADDAPRRRRRLVHRLDAGRPPDHGGGRARR